MTLRDALVALEKSLEDWSDDMKDGAYAALSERIEAMRAALDAAWPGMVGDAERAYALGWHACARWAERDDLHADTDSPAYVKERDAALLPAPPADGRDNAGIEPARSR